MAEFDYENCPECGHLNEVEHGLGLTSFTCEDCGTDWILCGDCGEWIDEEQDWDKDAMLCSRCAETSDDIFIISIEDTEGLVEVMEMTFGRIENEK